MKLKTSQRVQFVGLSFERGPYISIVIMFQIFYIYIAVYISLCVDTVCFVNKFLIVITLGKFRCISLSEPIEISLYLILDIRNGSMVSNRFATEQPAIRRERTRYGGGVSRHNCLAISQQHLRLWLHYRFGVTLLASRCFSYANSIAFSVESRGRKHAEPICVGSQCRLTISGERPLS